MKILFLGGKRRGYLCLKQILKSSDEVVGILGLREHPHEVKNYNSLEDLAQKHNIGFWSPDDVNGSSTVKIIKSLAPDLILVIGWYQFISKKIRSVPTRACIALHDSFLPKYRGSATTNWPIIRGETETGVTLFHLDAGLDTGDIVMQEKVPIYPRDNAETLLERTDEACVALVSKALPFIRENKISRVPQQHEEASYMSKRTPEDGLIDWDLSTREIDALIRALTYPFPGAFTYLNQKKIYIWEAEPYSNKAPEYHGIHGQIVNKQKANGVLVITGDGVLHVQIAQLEGQDMVSADELMGNVGEKLGISQLTLLHRISQLQETIDRLKTT